MGLIEKIEQIDRQLLFAINGSNSPLFDTIMWWVSKPAFGIPFYLLFIFLLFSPLTFNELKKINLFTPLLIACSARIFVPSVFTR